MQMPQLKSNITHSEMQYQIRCWSCEKTRGWLGSSDRGVRICRETDIAMNITAMLYSSLCPATYNKCNNTYHIMAVGTSRPMLFLNDTELDVRSLAIASRASQFPSGALSCRADSGCLTLPTGGSAGSEG